MLPTEQSEEQKEPIFVASSLEDLQLRALTCDRCPARAECVRPVFGEGNPNTGIVFVGKNPAGNEDLSGRSFSGPSGESLDSFLRLAGLSRNQVYLTNMALCATHKDRKLRKDEFTTCIRAHLVPLLRLLKPLLVVVMGEQTVTALTGRSMKSHGEVLWHKEGFFAMPVYHPSAVLHKAEMLSALEYDAYMVRNFMLNWKSWARLQSEKNAVH